MESTFRCCVTLSRPLSRDELLSCLDLLAGLAAGECGCPRQDLGLAAHLDIGPNHFSFPSVQELARQVAPLDQIDKALLTAFFNPFSSVPEEPFVSLSLSVSPGGALRVSAAARSEVRAQELALAILDHVSGLCPLQELPTADLGKKPENKDAEIQSGNARPDSSRNKKPFPIWEFLGLLVTVLGLLWEIAKHFGFL